MKTFAGRSSPFAVFSAATAFAIAAVCSAADTYIPIIISEPYGETFRSFEVPKSVSAAQPVTTIINAGPVVTGERYEVRQFPFPTTDSTSVAAGTTPSSTTLQSMTPLESGRQRDRNPSNVTNTNSGNRTSPPSSFPTIPSSLGGTGSTAATPPPALSTPAAPQIRPPSGFSLDGTESRTRSTDFGNTPPIASTLQDIFNTPPPMPQGTVDAAVIPKALVPAETAAETTAETNSAVKPADTKNAETEEENAGAKVNGTLLAATVILVMMLVFVVVTAADYHHRWVQSLTTLNRQYTIPSSESGWESAGVGLDYPAIGLPNDDLPSSVMYNTAYNTYNSSRRGSI